MFRIMIIGFGSMLLLMGCGVDQGVQELSQPFPVPQIKFAPRQYVCYRTEQPLSIDGAIAETDWQKADWTEPFVDIEGDLKPEPRFDTRVKMLWDSSYFYIAAEIEEPHVWGTLTQRDAVIYYDNDFEIFIDPDGDTQEYYELEMNVLNTVWDLLLIHPYRDGGPAVNAWDIQGLLSAVQIEGTLNDPSDKDRGWTAEIAIPWAVLQQCAHRAVPPHDGDQWRVNFSRVEWQVVHDGEGYAKVINLETGKPLPEDNWVWSPQGLINMHYPEMWGYVQFSNQPVGLTNIQFETDPVEEAKWSLRQVYYAQQNHLRQYGKYGWNLGALGLTNVNAGAHSWPPEIYATPSMFEGRVVNDADSSVVHIDQSGRVWVN